MAKCVTCGDTVMTMDLVDGLCCDCVKARDESEEGRVAQAGREEQVVQLSATIAAITLSTETIWPDQSARRLGVLTGSCVFGQHLGKDLLASVRDVFGGRSETIEKTFSDARRSALDDLRRQAAQIGAVAVVALQLEHTELSGGGKSMIMVTATGTAIG